MSTDATILADLRREVRAWLSSHVPADWEKHMTGASEEEFVAFQKDWFAALRDAGYAAPHWPKEWGGGGCSLAEQVVISEEMARAGAPRAQLYFISLYHVPGTLLEWGTDEQRSTYLPKTLAGAVWCQGFSEPGAGSDLAALRTRAVREGDHYVVNGQKIWSSQAQFSDYCLLLVRTDFEAPKHKGISYLIMDMKSPGITVRPIRQINGCSEFCEVFLDDVRIPVANLIGPENEGWKVAQATLSSERGITILDLAERLNTSFDFLIGTARKATIDGRPAVEDAGIRREIAAVKADVVSLRVLVSEQLQAAIEHRATGLEAPIIKLAYAGVLRRFTELGDRLQGLQSQVWQAGPAGAGYETNNWLFDYFNSWQWSIAGGSNEVMRNVISERGLGLPRG